MRATPAPVVGRDAADTLDSDAPKHLNRPQISQRMKVIGEAAQCRAASLAAIVARLTSNISASGMGGAPPVWIDLRKAAAQAFCPLSWRHIRCDPSPAIHRCAVGENCPTAALARVRMPRFVPLERWHDRRSNSEWSRANRPQTARDVTEGSADFSIPRLRCDPRLGNRRTGQMAQQIDEMADLADYAAAAGGFHGPMTGRRRTRVHGDDEALGPGSASSIVFIRIASGAKRRLNPIMSRPPPSPEPSRLAASMASISEQV